MSIDLEAIKARNKRKLTGINKHHGYITTTSSRCGIGVEDALVEKLYHCEYEDIPALLAEVERLAKGKQELIENREKWIRAHGELSAEVERQAAEIKAVTAERDEARERLCYTCNNGNHSAGIKHSASCDICPWHGQKGDADD